jgi:hypothetical protein
MRATVVTVILLLSASVTLPAQINSSANLGCTVTTGGGLGCGGIVNPEPNNEEKKLPRLSVTRYNVGPGGELERPSSNTDFLIIGINGGDLLNEMPPFRHVSLDKDIVTLMPKEQAFRLRNKTGDNVEFEVIEIQR